MINHVGLINDGLNTQSRSCMNNGGQTWTYNQGVILGAIAELHKNQPDFEEYMTTGLELAHASTKSHFLNPGGVLKEPCDGDCGPDAPTFKGVYMRNVMELNEIRKSEHFADYFRTQVQAIEANDKNDKNQYGLLWQGPFDKADASRQQSALEALLALNSVMQ